MTVKLFRNMRIFTPLDNGRPLCGNSQNGLLVIESGAMLCKNGVIEKIGNERDVFAGISPAGIDREYDLGGASVVPGFVDPHTHMCFAARREREFGLRLAGTPYLDILKAGGGILSSVKAVAESSEEELYRVTLGNVESALAGGTTTVEIKSGYGLSTDLELKMLRVINRVRRETPLDVAVTFMGAHAVPDGYKTDPDGYVDLMINEMLPAVKEQGLAEFCDIFCEDGVFSVGQSRKLLLAARGIGFKLKIHADEVHDLGGAGLAAELKTVSAEHLLAASGHNLAAMAASGVIAVLLPATAYSLKKEYADARRMIELGVPVALATDCNPGSCFCESMPFVFGLAVMNMNMTVEEALCAATLNSAYAICKNKETGSLEPGKNADFLVIDGESPAVFAYHAGGRQVTDVFKRGEKVA